jgi:hypothetical protein
MTTVSFVLFCVVNALQKELISIFMWHVFASGTHKLSPGDEKKKKKLSPGFRVAF